MTSHTVKFITQLIRELECGDHIWCNILDQQLNYSPLPAQNSRLLQYPHNFFLYSSFKYLKSSTFLLDKIMGERRYLECLLISLIASKLLSCFVLDQWTILTCSPDSRQPTMLVYTTHSFNFWSVGLIEQHKLIYIHKMGYWGITPDCFSPLHSTSTLLLSKYSV